MLLRGTGSAFYVSGTLLKLFAVLHSGENNEKFTGTVFPRDLIRVQPLQMGRRTHKELMIFCCGQDSLFDCIMKIFIFSCVAIKVIYYDFGTFFGNL